MSHTPTRPRLEVVPAARAGDHPTAEREHTGATRSASPAPWLSWFCVWQSDALATPDQAELDALHSLVDACPGLLTAHVMLPTPAHDPYYPSAKGSPALILQLEFCDLAHLENNLRADGHLAPLVDPTLLGRLGRIRPAHEAMLTRRYPVPDPRIRRPGGQSLTYWVEYSGPADDANAWHVHYTEHHPQLLAGLPGIRAIEIYTPAVIVCGLPLSLRPCLQRNKTVFDDAAAMNAAMQSPVRNALREDFHRLPAFQGTSLHFPFQTTTWRPAAPKPA